MLTAKELPDTDPIDSLPEERRSELRYPCRLKVLHRPSEHDDALCGDVWYAGRLLDIARHGVALATRVKYFPGAVISIMVSARGGNAEKEIRARATNLTHVENAHWRVGCELLEPLTEDEVQSFVDAGDRKR